MQTSRPNQRRRWVLIAGSIVVIALVALAILQVTAPTQTTLVQQLQHHGATVSVGGTIDEPFFAAPSHAVSVNGQQVIMVEYATPLQRWNDARQISPSGGTIGSTHVMWIGAAHFYGAGRVMAFYIGADTSITHLLTTVLGPQFAGA